MKKKFFEPCTDHCIVRSTMDAKLASVLEYARVSVNLHRDGVYREKQQIDGDIFINFPSL